AGRRLSETASRRRSNCGLAACKKGQSGKEVGNVPPRTQSARKSSPSRWRTRQRGSHGHCSYAMKFMSHRWSENNSFHRIGTEDRVGALRGDDESVRFRGSEKPRGSRRQSEREILIGI